MDNFIERLQYFMKDRGINDNQITVAASLSIGLIGKAKASGKGMSSSNIEKILLAYPELNSDWLLTGRGTMLNYTLKFDNNYIQIFDRIFDRSFPQTGLSLDEFAEYCRIPLDTMHLIHNKQVVMDDNQIGIIRNKLGLSSNWLMTGFGKQYETGSFDKEKFQNEYNAFKLLSKKDESFIYVMYKEEKEENKKLIREIGALEERLKQYEDTNSKDDMMLLKEPTAESGSSMKNLSNYITGVQSANTKCSAIVPFGIEGNVK